MRGPERGRVQAILENRFFLKTKLFKISNQPPAMHPRYLKLYFYWPWPIQFSTVSCP